MADGSAREQWEKRYADSERIWSGRPNATLTDLVGGLPRGRALDLGSGEGGDVLWLAAEGWTAIGVDISDTAVRRAGAAATAAGLGPEQARFIAADLAGPWPVEGDFDLVTASFLQSMAELPRIAILRRAAELVAPGGHLALVTHAAPPPGSEHAHELRLPTPREELDELALDPAEWTERVVELREREAPGRDGGPVTHVDGVVLLERTR